MAPLTVWWGPLPRAVLSCEEFPADQGGRALKAREEQRQDSPGAQDRPPDLPCGCEQRE